MVTTDRANMLVANFALLSSSPPPSVTPVYRIGTTSKSQAAEAKFWSLEHPLSAEFHLTPSAPDHFEYADKRPVFPGS